MTDFELVRPNRLCNDLVFADGIGSSGKGMVSHILASFERIEKQSNHTPFDYIAYMHFLGKMSTDAARVYLQTEADQQLYHIMMSRDVNFRPFDSTGVLQNPKRFEYLARLFMKEGDPVLERINEQKPILNEAPHDALRSAPLFFEAFGLGLKYVYVLRDPFELILDWHRRGFGDRIGKDPREFQFNLSINGKVAPMFMLDFPVDYDDLNQIERIMLMILFCVKHNLLGYEATTEEQRKNVLVTTFDNLCQAPFSVVEQMEELLEVKHTSITKKTLKKENLPRNRDETVGFKPKVLEQIRPELLKYVEETNELYERFNTYVKP